MKRIVLLILTMLIIVPSSQSKIKIVASTSDIASIAEQIGGDQIELFYICPASANPHSVEILPSYMIRVTKADIYLKVGMMLDFWADPIIDGSRNRNLKVVDCSRGVEPLEVPIGKVDASMGDIHAAGNPHYWLDPVNGVIIAQNIHDALIEIDPKHRDKYDFNLKLFQDEMSDLIYGWKQMASPLNGLKIVTYHNSWVYFSDIFKLNVVGFVEPKPGIEPTPSHTNELVKLIKAHSVLVIGMEPYFSNRAPNAIAAATDAVVVKLPPSVKSIPEVDDYFDLFDYLINTLIRATEGSK